jgi:DNA modification methylase
MLLTLDATYCTSGALNVRSALIICALMHQLFPYMPKLLNAQKIELVPLEAIQPYVRNARLHSQANVAKLVASIREFGWTTPILLDEGGAVLAGHGRLLAAQALSMAQVPALRLSGLSSAQKRAYRLADNRLTLDSDWDLDALKLELSEIELDLALTGFDPKELDDMLGRNGPQEGEDQTPPLEQVAVSQLGEIWALGAHRLICADACNATEVARLLAGVTPSVMVTDPPYGVEYDPKWREATPFGVKRTQYMSQGSDGDSKSDWSDAFAIVVAPVAYVWHACMHSREIEIGLERIGFELRAQLIWVKEHAAISRGHYSYQHEPCWYAVQKGKTANWKGDAYESTVIHAKMVKTNSGEDFVSDHGCQKPVELMRRPIVNHTSSGQAVYDPFMGSGTTIIAAETTQRVAYGCEINPLYVDMAIRRWQTFTGKEATRLEDGKAFNG